MRCPLCNLRPAKRSCPALSRAICPVCCGTKRRTEIRCPETCPYLASSRTHPPAAVRRQRDQDLALLGPALAGLSEARRQLFLFSLVLVGRFRGEGLDAASDGDVAAAAGALAATYDTASRGLIYERRPDSVPAQRIADGLKGTFDRLGHGRPSGFAADAAEVLRQLEGRVAAVQRLAPSDPRAFLELAARVVASMASETGTDSAPHGEGPPEPGGSPLILP